MSQLPCPKCSTTLTKGDRGYHCRSCNFRMPYIYRGFRIPLDQIKKLFTQQYTDWIDYWNRRDGKGSFTGRLLLSETYTLKFEAKKVNWANCPHCKSDLYYFTKGIFCGKCNFTLWRKIAGRDLLDSEIMQLITYKKTEKLDRFINPDTGKFFSTSLYIDETGKVAFSFEE